MLRHEWMRVDNVGYAYNMQHAIECFAFMTRGSEKEWVG